jgi:ribosomal protein S18 acetylase RimI-like enzyme
VTERIRHLELIGHRAWPALEEEWVNGWLLRAGGGVTRRSNSASPVHDLAPDSDLECQLDRCEAWFKQRRLPPIFRLTPLADGAVDGLLDGRGYQLDDGAAIMTRLLAGLPPIDSSMVDVASAPSKHWLDLMAEEPGRSGEKQAVLRRMLGRIEGPAGYAGVGAGDGMLAIGLAVVVDDHVALFMMRTREAARRGGLATAVAGALMGWGAGRGATSAFLQVHPANEPARTLYRGLGFREEYEYWYRMPAGSRSVLRSGT